MAAAIVMDLNLRVSAGYRAKLAANLSDPLSTRGARPMSLVLRRLPIALTVVLVAHALACPASAQQPARDTGAEIKILERAFDSALLGRSVPFHVYLPPSYGAESSQRYPVVYWLHGSNGSPAVASRIVSRLYDHGFRAGRLPETIVVFPDGLRQSMWVDAESGDSSVESYLVSELVPHIDKTYATISNTTGRLVEGGSMGGYGAARLLFKYPHVFGAASMLSAGPLQARLDPDDAPIVGRQHAAKVLREIYGNDGDYFYQQSPWYLATKIAEAARASVVLRITVGDADPVFPANEAFVAHLESLSIPHQFDVLPGVGHAPRQLFQALAASDAYWDFNAAFLAAANVTYQPVAYPDEPIAEICGAITTDRLTGGLVLQFDRTGRFSGHSFGDVTTTEGERWGFLESIEGAKRGSYLDVTIVSAVEGDLVTREFVWTLRNTALATHRGEYEFADCPPIFDEYLRRARSAVPPAQTTR